MAGRFVAIAKALEIPMNNLARMLNKRDGYTPIGARLRGNNEKKGGKDVKDISIFGTVK